MPVTAGTVIVALALLPLARWVVLGYTGAWGPNPAEFLARSSGTWTLAFLALTLTMSPLHRLSGWTQPIAWRRTLGLACFFYACLHALCWAWFDQGFEAATMLADLATRPFIALGMLAFAILCAMALTSSRNAKRKLGKRWKTLHRGIYGVALLVVLHYLWHKAGKNDFSEAGPWSVLLLVLLGFRLLPAAWMRRIRGAG
ncbi:MAG: sulfite oxidase heme-binding subunit YedZ [Betaproteobacteria bacterium]|nr:sulfoxide reductase heme-binding subunit YedZ [Betaproteobacteria bacterium]